MYWGVLFLEESLLKYAYGCPLRHVEEIHQNSTTPYLKQKLLQTEQLLYRRGIAVQVVQLLYRREKLFFEHSLLAGPRIATFCSVILIHNLLKIKMYLFLFPITEYFQKNKVTYLKFPSSGDKGRLQI